MILIVLIAIWKLFKFATSAVLLIVVAAIIIYLVYTRRNIEKFSINSYPDMSNLYDIRSYYYLNPNAFDGLINNINNFIQLYEEIMDTNMLYCAQNVQVAVNFSRLAQNNLQSIIYTLNSAQPITKRFHHILRKFQSIMFKYTEKIINKCNRKFTAEYMNSQSTYYDNIGPKPANFFYFNPKGST